MTAFDCDIEVEKTVGPDTICNGLTSTVTYTFRVWNPGDVDLTNVTVNDNQLGNLTANFVAANGGSSTLSTVINSLANAVVFTIDIGLTGSQDNEVEVTGDALGLTPADTASAQATVMALSCVIQVTKVCVDATAPGEPITFSGAVTNAGDVTLTDVTVTDDSGTPDDASDDVVVLGPIDLDSGDSANYSGAYTAAQSGSSTDTVTATGDALGLTPADTATAQATCVTPAVLPSVLPPTPTPVALPAALPPTGVQGALNGSAANVIMFLLIGITLIGGSAWMFWSNRHREDRHSNRF